LDVAAPGAVKFVLGFLIPVSTDDAAIYDANDLVQN
jgi:hypothetical protein